ncbi:MAG TPA: DedA family protein [Pyrinomonadaceae bacterium]|nr:DedA family protein [Pyrinomonadaceae bacterium]
MSDYLLATLGVYGVPVLFVALLVGSAGVPLPASLLLVAAGSFVEQGELDLWPVLALSAAGAIAGDNIGYAVGRWGGRRVTRRLGRLVGGEKKIEAAEAWLKRREGVGVFLSRWLLTPLGPVVNLTAGATRYAWPRFLLYDVLGEALWVALYVLLGKFFSDRVQALNDVLGDLTWAVVGLVAAALLGVLLFKHLREPDAD